MNVANQKFEEFKDKFGTLESEELIEAAYKTFGINEVAAFSSFGAFSSLLLSIVAKTDTKIPIIFINTGKHFKDTLEYVDMLKKEHKIERIIELNPDEKIIGNIDADGELWKTNVNRCCWARKVEPLDRHLEANKYSVIITGRRAYQTKERKKLETIELDEKGYIKINPLANWSRDKVREEFKSRNLIQHPLFDKGYPSVGCSCCTRAVKPGEGLRSGRWAHTMDMEAQNTLSQKTECGIHLPKSEVQKWITS